MISEKFYLKVIVNCELTNNSLQDALLHCILNDLSIISKFVNIEIINNNYYYH